jgi:hypothetical protein
VAGDNESLRGDRRGELIEQPRLANPRLAIDEHHSGAAGCSIRESGAQRVKFDTSPDHVWRPLLSHATIVPLSVTPRV